MNETLFNWYRHLIKPNCHDKINILISKRTISYPKKKSRSIQFTPNMRNQLENDDYIKIQLINSK